MEAGCRNLIPAQEQKARTFMAYTDRELLARLVQCEAGGEGENGMKAVASVVMNRVNAVGRRICADRQREPAQHRFPAGPVCMCFGNGSWGI